MPFRLIQDCACLALKSMTPGSQVRHETNWAIRAGWFLPAMRPSSKIPIVQGWLKGMQSIAYTLVPSLLPFRSNIWPDLCLVSSMWNSQGCYSLPQCLLCCSLLLHFHQSQYHLESNRIFIQKWPFGEIVWGVGYSISACTNWLSNWKWWEQIRDG